MAAVKAVGLSLVAATGIAGLVADRWPAYLPVPAMSLHALFGVALLSMTVMSFRRGVFGVPLSAAAALVLRRRLSRSVYLVLYLVFGADQIVRTGWGADSQPPDNLRDYFAYGVLALLAIRALAALSVRRPPEPQMNPRSARVEGVVAPL